MNDVPETPAEKGSAEEILAERTRTDVTRLLGELSRGKEEALGQLMPLLYSELRRLASYYRRGLDDLQYFSSRAVFAPLLLF